MYFDDLCSSLSRLPEVEAIALGGSRAGECYDETSDYDLYVYCAPIPSEEARKAFLGECCAYMELSNSFWELEDDCTLKDGVDIDILYRDLGAFARELSSVVDDCVARNGYTTCMWHNLLNSRVIFDRAGDYGRLQERYSVRYPERLRRNIISRNMRLLTGNLPSYDSQILKAVRRGDLVSVNHRTAALMESYFDVIFALNGMTHPGEKRLVAKALEGADVLPDGFERDVKALYQDLFSSPAAVEGDVGRLVGNLSSCLLAAGYEV